MPPTKAEDYTVGWICAIGIEYWIACELLDEEYDKKDWPKIKSDQNTYQFGRIHEHNVVIACLPEGRHGISRTAVLAYQISHDFPALRFGLLVGIGGGAPSWNHDIRLGDIVVSSPEHTHGGVLQYDFGKALQDREFSITNRSAIIPTPLLNAVRQLQRRHVCGRHHFNNIVQELLTRNPNLGAKYQRPDPEYDRLYSAFYVHKEDCDCEKRPSNQRSSLLVPRQEREEPGNAPVVHYGLIASANTLVKDANLRDALIKKYDVLCFEMEAAGLLDDIPCIVIRGICDYSDSHKNDLWQGYAAAMAGSYAKDLLEFTRGQDIANSETASDVIRSRSPESQRKSDKLGENPAQRNLIASNHKSMPNVTDAETSKHMRRSHSSPSDQIFSRTVPDSSRLPKKPERKPSFDSDGLYASDAQPDSPEQASANDEERASVAGNNSMTSKHRSHSTGEIDNKSKEPVDIVSRMIGRVAKWLNQNIESINSTDQKSPTNRMDRMDKVDLLDTISIVLRHSWGQSIVGLSKAEKKALEFEIHQNAMHDYFRQKYGDIPEVTDAIGDKRPWGELKGHAVSNKTDGTAQSTSTFEKIMSGVVSALDLWQRSRFSKASRTPPLTLTRRSVAQLQIFKAKADLERKEIQRELQLEQQQSAKKRSKAPLDRQSSSSDSDQPATSRRQTSFRNRAPEGPPQYGRRTSWTIEITEQRRSHNSKGKSPKTGGSFGTNLYQSSQMRPGSTQKGRCDDNENSSSSQASTGSFSAPSERTSFSRGTSRHTKFEFTSESDD